MSAIQLPTDFFERSAIRELIYDQGYHGLNYLLKIYFSIARERTYEIHEKAALSIANDAGVGNDAARKMLEVFYSKKLLRLCNGDISANIQLVGDSIRVVLP